MSNAKKGNKNEEYNILSLVPTPVLIIDRDYNVDFLNDAGLSMLGKDREDVIGAKCYDLMKTGHCQTDQCGCKRTIESGSPVSAETTSEGLGDIHVKYHSGPMRDEDGKIVGCVECLIDITDTKKLQEKTVEMAKDILEVSTPIVTVFDDILALPIIGTLDSERTQQIMETVLQRIVDTRARVVIMDITGVPIVDTLVAAHLLKAANAIRLLGATAIVTGISPKIAQTLVGLGVDLSEVNTRAQMVDGVEMAFEILKKKVVDKEEKTHG